MGDEEAHVLVGDLHRGRSVHPRHRDHVWKRYRAKGSAQVENRDVSSERRGTPARAQRSRRWRRRGGEIQEVGRTTRKNSRSLFFPKKTKEKEGKKEKKNQGWFHPDSGQAEADEGSVQRVELPHPGRGSAASGRRPSSGSAEWDGWRGWRFTRPHRWRAGPGSSLRCPSETP